MRHSRAMRHLADYGAGRLPGTTSRQLRAHVEECVDCREWLETYRLVAGRPRASELFPGEHPSSDLLARRAAAVDTLSASELHLVDGHVQECVLCRSALHLSRAALESAAESDRVDLWDRMRNRFAQPQLVLRAGLAAALLLLAVGLLVTDSLGPPRDERLAGEFLAGARVVTARDSILAEETTVGGDADLTLRAGEVVSLGDGFSVGSGASLTIELTSLAARHDQSTRPRDALRAQPRSGRS